MTQHDVNRKAAADALISYFRHGVQPEDVPNVDGTAVSDLNGIKEKSTRC